jgi:hypothetical protein
LRKGDYFLNQIDILGRVLGKIFSDLLGLKTKDQVLEIESVSEMFINELDFDSTELMTIPTVELIEFNSAKKKKLISISFMARYMKPENLIK